MAESVNIMNTEEEAEAFRNRVQFLTKKNDISDDNKHLLTIVNNHFDIYYYSKYGMFAVINDAGEDVFHIRDISDNLDGNFNMSTLDVGKKIKYLIHNGYIVDIDESKIIERSFFPSFGTYISGFMNSFVDTWMNSEYKSLNTELSKPQNEINTFNTNLLNRSKFEFEEIIKSVNDPQFTHNLEEILGAYNRGWFFVAASSVGSLMEYLYYETAINYNKPDFAIHKDNPTHVDFKKKMQELRNFTKNMPEDQQIRFGNAELLDMERGYLTRNAVSHHDSGFANEQEVNTLFIALRRAYEHYFLPSLNYKVAHPEVFQ